MYLRIHQILINYRQMQYHISWKWNPIDKWNSWFLAHNNEKRGHLRCRTSQTARNSSAFSLVPSWPLATNRGWGRGLEGGGRFAHLVHLMKRVWKDSLLGIHRRVSFKHILNDTRALALRERTSEEPLPRCHVPPAMRSAQLQTVWPSPAWYPTFFFL